MALDLRVARLDVRLREPFRVSREAYQVQHAVVIALVDGDDFGLGEATAFSVYGVSVDSLLRAFERCRDVLAGWDFHHPTGLLQSLEPSLGSDPFALCALDVAAHDLWAKRAEQPLYRCLQLDQRLAPPSSMSIGLGDAEVMAAKVKAVADWPILKIKLGAANVVPLIERLRRETDAVFRVDANCSWTVDETIRNSRALRALGVESIEQPLPRSAWDEMAEVRRGSVLPVLADESCCVEADLESCAESFDGVNIKLMKCGGLRPALRMIEKARGLGLQVQLGCMPETSIGASAIAHLAPAVDGVDMDSITVLAEDVAIGATLDRGAIAIPDVPGLGLSQISPSLLAALSLGCAHNT